VKHADLTRLEQEALTRALRAPALWPLALLAGEVGFDQAVEACAHYEVPDAAVAAFEACAYRAEDLPSYSDVIEMIQGVRLKLAWQPRSEPLQTAARRVGLSVQDAQAALRTLSRFGAKVEHLSALRSRPSS
jgi:hypothetical protein